MINIPVLVCVTLVCVPGLYHHASFLGVLVASFKLLHIESRIGRGGEIRVGVTNDLLLALSEEAHITSVFLSMT